VRLKVAHHVAELDVPKSTKVVCAEPLLDVGGMVDAVDVPIEGGVPYVVKGTLEVAAREKEDIENRF